MRVRKLGILGALDIEVKYLRELITAPTVWESAGRTFFEGTLAGMPVVLAWADVGKVNAALTTQVLIDRGHAQAVVFTGVAGSLDPNLRIGELLVASGALYHDVDVTAFGYEPGQVPRLPKIFATDPVLTQTLTACVKELGFRPYTGLVASGDSFITGSDLRAVLATRYGAQAVEMEGAAVAHACYLNHIPFALLRAISDRADGTAACDFRSFSIKAAQRAAEVVSCLCRHLFTQL